MGRVPARWTRRAALGFVPALAACGFVPVRGPSGAAAGLQGLIDVADPDDPTGFALVRALEDRLGTSDTPRYRLAADIFLGAEGIGVTAQQNVTRTTLLARVPWRLAALDGAIVADGEARGFTGYSTTSTSVATLAARRDAEERLMRIVADEIVADLLATSPAWQ